MLCERNAGFSPSGFISSEKWYWNFKMLLLELIKNVSKEKLTYLILCCQILLANFVFCRMTLAKLKIYFSKIWTVVLLGRRKAYGLCLEFCWNPHTRDGQSPCCQCSLTALNYVNLLCCLHETFQRKAGGLLQVCVRRESPSFVETAP